MTNTFKILVINPGSTSTKLGVFKNDELKHTEILRHSEKEINQFPSIYSQFEFRKKFIIKFLEDKKIDIKSFSAIVGRGGLTKPVSGGTTKVNELMLDELKHAKYGQHASNLGAVLASSIANDINVPSFVVNPVVVDEMHDLARVAGHPIFYRRSLLHCLNHKAVSMEVAKELGKDYKESNFVFAHIGGGISVAVHNKGRIIDVNDALLGDGPFSPERSGGVPAGQLLDLCFSGKYKKEEIYKMLAGKGGIVAHLGTNNMKEVSARVQKGDKKAKLIYEAMAYQIAKEIGACATVLKGKVDRIILSGGVTHDENFCNLIKKRVEFIAPVKVYAGEEELKPLALGGLRVLKGEEEALEYE